MVSAFIQPAAARSRHDRLIRRRTIAVVFLYFLIAGMATVMLGPALPLLADRWRLPDAQLGTLFFASFTGQFCGAWLAARRLGMSLLLGAGVTAFGFFALTLAGLTLAHLALFCIGLGLGAGLTAGNVIVGTLDDIPLDRELLEESLQSTDRARRSRLLALLNASWGVGAIVCPLWLRTSIRLAAWASPASFADRIAATGGGVFFLGFGLIFLGATAFTLWLMPRKLYLKAASTGMPGTWRWRTVWMFIATLALYVGVENTLGGWLPTYAQRMTATGLARASSIALCFWVSELTGRSLTALLIKRVDEYWFYRACIAMLIGLVGMLVFVPRFAADHIFIMTAAIAGCLAPLFPLAVAFLLERTGNHPQVGKVFASASLGGTILPWLTGVCSTYFASLRIGFVVPGIGAAMLLFLSIYLPEKNAVVTADK